MRFTAPTPFMIGAVSLGAILSGCAAEQEMRPAEDGVVRVVASTNVYGEIAAELGGDEVRVTSIIDDPNQDPHSFEGSARVQLELSRADIVIVNGGGYDDWASTLLRGAENEDAVVLNVTDISGYDTGGDFNEHLWYDVPTMRSLAVVLGEALVGADPGLASTVTNTEAAFASTLDEIAQRESALADRVRGTGVAITEPVPLYLLEACGFENVTPSAFSEAIEEGDDVPPLALKQTEELFADGAAALLVYNEQASSPETERVLAAAEAAGVPAVPVTETAPAELSYGAWMASILSSIEAVI